MHDEPITPETFPAAWKYAQRRQYWARKKTVIRYLVTIVSQMLFFCTFTILVYGILYELSAGELRSFLEKTRGAVLSWEKFSAILFTGAGTQTEKLARLALFLYGVPLGASLTAALAVGLLYHPISPRLPQGEREQAQALLAMVQSIRSTREKKYSGVTAFCGLLFGLIALGAAAFFFLYYEFALCPTTVYFALGALGTIAAYWLCNLLMQLVLMPLWYTRMPENFFRSADAYCRSFRRNPQA